MDDSQCRGQCRLPARAFDQLAAALRLTAADRPVPRAAPMGDRVANAAHPIAARTRTHFITAKTARHIVQRGEDVEVFKRPGDRASRGKGVSEGASTARFRVTGC